MTVDHVTTHPGITADDVRAAAGRLSTVAYQTPVLGSRSLAERVGAEVLVKCENLQRTGSFKFRGAYNALSRLGPDQLSRGVIAFSSGNHALAVAAAARMLGTTAMIVMPSDAPTAKRTAVADLGAQIVQFDRYTEDRFAITDRAGRRARTRHHPAVRPPRRDRRSGQHHRGTA